MSSKKKRKLQRSLWRRLVHFASTYDLTAQNIRTLFKNRKKSTAHRFKRFFLFIVVLLLVIPVVLVLPVALLLRDLPSPKTLTSGDFPVSTHIYDRNGELLYEIYADQNRTPIKLSDLPNEVKHSTIAIEDKHFYRHFGLDLFGILRAFLNNVGLLGTRNQAFVPSSGRGALGTSLQGGSTITQQLVKMTLLTPQRTFERKLKEAFLAIATEIFYSKDQILEMYLNHAPYGGTAYGIEQASQLYFNKPAKEITLGEAAFLAGLPQAPTRYSPFGAYPELANERKKEVLRRMREDGYIKRENEQQAAGEELSFATPDVPIRAPHFVFWVKDLLVSAFGEGTVERGGLRVTTTLDLDLQDAAQASVSAEIASLERLKVGNGAALVTNPSTGEILAMVGSRDYFDVEHHGNVNVTVRPRQPGSSIKPLMYATAFSIGKLTPSSMWLDIPTCFKVPNQKDYCPKNYDGTFHGPVQVRFALGNSYNLPAVKSLAYIGVDTMIATASAMGITTFTDPSRYGLSLTLGGGEVTMTDMATAFGTLANNGVKVPLNPFLKIEDYRGKILYEYSEDKRKEDLKKISGCESEDSCEDLSSSSLSTIHYPQPIRAIPPEAAYLTSHILLDNNARSGAFGASSKLVIPNQVVSAKTGTTNDLKDNWTLGYTPERLVAVWVGNNDGKPMNQSLVSGVTGAAPIWNSIMKFVLKDRDPLWPERPEGIVGRDICSLTGRLPTPDSPCDTRHEFFWEQFLPENNAPQQRDIWIQKDNGFPIDLSVPLDQQGELELQNHTVLSDPLIPEFCMDCAYPVVEELNPDGSVKESRVNYPGSMIDISKL